MAGMADETRRFYAVQFHPEVTHTTQGASIYSRFVHDICGCGNDWTTGNIIEDAIARMTSQVGSSKVLLGLSGGVDSSVVAALLHKAIGAQLTCVFVDNGLLRQNEGDQVMQVFGKHLGVKVIRVDARGALPRRRWPASVDPEAKRKIIGRVFIEVFDEEAHKLKDVAFLAQGTIYPDVIESAGGKTGKAHVIKSHHNVGGLPEHMKLKLVEPLRELFKDEVRAIGLELGLPREMIQRHPFPGPGLGVRILGEVSQEAADNLRKADAIFIEELRTARLVRPDQPGVRGVPAGEERRRHGRRPPPRAGDCAARRRDRGLHDRALGTSAVRPARTSVRAASSTRCRGFRALSTTFLASRPPPSSGNRVRMRYPLAALAGRFPEATNKEWY